MTGVCADRGRRRTGLRNRWRRLGDPVLDQVRQRGHGRLSVRALGRQGQRVAMTDPQGHHRHRAACIGPAVPGQDGGLGLPTAGFSRHQRRGSGVQPVRQRHGDGARDSLGLHRGRVGCALPHWRKGHQLVAHLDQPVSGAADNREGFAVGDDDGGQQALRPSGQQVEVEADQQLTGHDGLTDRHLGREPLSAEGHGLQPDMHQDLGAIDGAQADGMPGGRQVRNDTVAGRVQQAGGRIDGQPVAQDPIGEHLVGRLVQAADPALQRRFQDDVGQRLGSFRYRAARSAGTAAPVSRRAQSMAHNGSRSLAEKVRHRSCLPPRGGIATLRAVTPGDRVAGVRGILARRSPVQLSMRTSSSPSWV